MLSAEPITLLAHRRADPERINCNLTATRVGWGTIGLRSITERAVFYITNYGKEASFSN